jgi:catechol 2,3-dioxygenase-like lactoylglutathione lyase family enzyme
MWSPVTTIRLSVQSTDLSTAFYEALLGVRAARREANAVGFDLESPPLALTIQPPLVGRASAPEIHPPTAKAGSRFALYVSDPHQIGEVAIALRRARVPLRLGDRGLSTRDPDGNEWSVLLGSGPQRRPVEQETGKGGSPP